jgi:hypothetical protein
MEFVRNVKRSNESLDRLSGTTHGHPLMLLSKLTDVRIITSPAFNF